MASKTYIKYGLSLIFILAITAVVFAQNTTPNDSLLLAPNLQQISLKQKPSSFASSYTYDPKLNLYFYNVKVGEINAEQPLVLTPSEFRARVVAEKTRAYVRQKQQALAGLVTDEDTQKDLLPDYYVNSKFFEKIFGSNEINIRPQGSASIDLGLRLFSRSIV